MRSILLLACLLATLGEGFRYPPIYPPWLSGASVEATESSPIKETSTNLKATESPAPKETTQKPMISRERFKHIVRKFIKLVGDLKNTQSMFEKP